MGHNSVWFRRRSLSFKRFRRLSEAALLGAEEGCLELGGEGAGSWILPLVRSPARIPSLCSAPAARGTS